jgi:hypothetical protein
MIFYVSCVLSLGYLQYYPDRTIKIMDIVRFIRVVIRGKPIIACLYIPGD